MIDKLLNLLSFSSDSLDSININIFKKLVNFLMAMDFVDESSQEFNQSFIVILDTEEEAIK